MPVFSSFYLFIYLFIYLFDMYEAIYIQTKKSQY